MKKQDEFKIAGILFYYMTSAHMLETDTRNNYWYTLSVLLKEGSIENMYNRNSIISLSADYTRPKL